MSVSYTTTLLDEDWSDFPVGPIRRDNSARGEYMAMVVPANPNGWYHNASAGPAGDMDHSRFQVAVGDGGKCLVLSQPPRAWGPSVVLTRGEETWRDMHICAVVTVEDHLTVGVAARYRTNRDYYAAVFEGGMFKLIRVLEGTITVLDAVPRCASWGTSP